MRITPLFAAVALLVTAAGLLVTGVLVLAGPGWSILAAVPCLTGAGLVLLRGALRVAQGAADV